MQSNNMDLVTLLAAKTAQCDDLRLGGMYVSDTKSCLSAELPIHSFSIILLYYFNMYHIFAEIIK